MSPNSSMSDGLRRLLGADAPIPRPPASVTLADDWVNTWTNKLTGDAIKLYLQLSNYYEQRKEFDQAALEEAHGAEANALFEQEIPNLKEAGLVEIIEHDGRSFMHLPHRLPKGLHKAEAVLPSIKEGLEFQRHMNEEILRISSLDDNEEVRNEYFGRYPELREEFTVYEETKDDDSPHWRLWLELSRLLIREFEERFGALRASHNELFKESASQILSHKLDIIDAVTGEVVDNKEKIFTEVGKNWVVTTTDEAFMKNATVLALAERYDIGPAQIFVNTLEKLTQVGFAIAETNPKGYLLDLFLPTTTGLTKSEERILFLRPEERARGVDSDRNRERARRAANKYANYLMERGCELLHLFVNRDRVKALDELLVSIAMRVNESLDLIPNDYEEEAVTVEHVLEKYNDVRERAHRAEERQSRA
ncbi:MAG: hypothetical protein P1V97_17365 [Planctomycetota bacterium]|nr:hypothetical protein [Planctomycetota bacterium]